jgi:thienamycin biosynthesis protein ThnO
VTVASAPTTTQTAVPPAVGAGPVAGAGRTDPAGTAGAPSRAPVRVPGRVGASEMMGSRPAELTGAAGAVVAEVGVTGRLVQFRMADLAARSARTLRAIDDDAWFGLLRRAAGLVRDAVADGTATPTLAALSAATGLPVRRARHGVETVAADLARMDEILAAQVPGGDLAVYRTGLVPDRSWRWSPAGRSAFVRVPANFPTIVVEWLQVLAARRPTLLGTSGPDPFTSTLFADALYRAGLPDGALSVCHGDAPALARLADQVLWPGENVPDEVDGRKLKTYHFGRSKAVLADYQPDDAEWEKLARMAHHGCGRLCTNLSTLLVAGDADAAARRLAAELALPVLPLDDPRAVVPAFADRGQRDALARLIEREVAAGAVDVTAEVTGAPLVQDVAGLAFLRPTVLLVEADSPLYGMELPFPFVTVTKLPRSRIPAACAGSLIVSVLGDRSELVDRLIEEPGVDKVFAGDEFDRGYDPLDPHEGYLADFLFRKKAVRVPAPPAGGESPG